LTKIVFYDKNNRFANYQKSDIMKLPGLIDAHVHLRTPGGEHKEDLRTGTAAALAGGFTTLLAMPNTLPPLVTCRDWRIAQIRAQSEGQCDVFLYAGASADHIDQLPDLAQSAVALKIYLNETYGPLRVEGVGKLSEIVQNWPASKPIAVHAEGDSVGVVIAMAALYQRRFHICHVSRKDEIELIAAAKKRGLPVTCEVTPHHLFLTEDDADRLGPLGDMRPRLATQADVDALWAQINTTVDCIASDHAPHTLEEKGIVSRNNLDGAVVNQEKTPPPGAPGLESTLPLMLTAVAEGRITLERVVALLYTNPRLIFNLREQPETWVEVDEHATYTFPDHPLFTKCGWSPFEGMQMKGRIRKVVYRGKEVFRDGRLFLNKN